jgi:hypothetical protein
MCALRKKYVTINNNNNTKLIKQKNMFVNFWAALLPHRINSINLCKPYVWINKKILLYFIANAFEKLRTESELRL